MWIWVGWKSIDIENNIILRIILSLSKSLKMAIKERFSGFIHILSIFVHHLVAFTQIQYIGFPSVACEIVRRTCCLPGKLLNIVTICQSIPVLSGATFPAFTALVQASDDHKPMVCVVKCWCHVTQPIKSVHSDADTFPVSVRQEPAAKREKKENLGST